MMTRLLTLSFVLGAVACGSADAPVSTVEADVKAYQFCGGIAGFPCPSGYTCVDNPHDNCDPRRGGADCGGICVRRGKPNQCNYNEPGLHYVGTSAEECSLIKFVCAVGTTYFSNACGCGCQDVAPCTSQECGPAPAAPNYLCADGVTVGGPGPCVRGADGVCGWTWVTCPESCPIIDCAAPPAGCHYEGAITSPCDQQTCGKLVCDGGTL
jgi:hypothetical protein